MAGGELPTIPLFKVFMAPPEELDKPITSVLHSGYVTQGVKVEEFEEKMRTYLGSSYVLSLNSATSGLHLALHLLKRKDSAGEGDWPGLIEHVDEVLTCPLTCTATNWPILANGLRIKWVDVDPESSTVCLDDLEAKLSPTTKVIMLVHWGGMPVELRRIEGIKQRCFEKFGFRPMVIEDCAHALGAQYDGRPIGGSGNFCVFSTQAIKHLTTIDGGVLTCPNDKFYQRGKLVRWFGIDRERRSGGGDFRMEPDIAEFGYKFHMNDVAATVGLANFAHLPGIIKRCQDNGDFYDEQLKNLPHIFRLRPTPGARSAYWIYTMRVTASLRGQFIEHMKKRGVVVSAVHQRNDIHSCVAQYSVLLPKLNVFADEMICLPVGWWVSDVDRERVVEAIRDFSAQSTKLYPALTTNTPRENRQRCIITGGCGFIGHHVVEHFVKNTDYEVVVLDKLSYASNGYDRLRDSGVFHLIQTFCVDLSNPIPPGLMYEIGSERVAVILHIAAETHVDNSIETPVPFVQNNITSTLNVLEWARTLPNLKHLIYFSTDEVYGSAADDQAFKEDDAHKPSNPYSASKSAAEMICQSYHNTYAVPIITMNVMNAFGERQHCEKFIPLCIKYVMEGKKLTIHAHKGSQRPGSRFYIHARNIAAAVLFVLTHGEVGERYNVQGERELDNLELAQFIARELGKPLNYELHDAPNTRPGHDLRYSLDGEKMREMGWRLPLTFEESLSRTINWTIANPKWLEETDFGTGTAAEAAKKPVGPAEQRVMRRAPAESDAQPSLQARAKL